MKLTYYARLKVVEASSIKQPRPQSNLKNKAKRRTGDKEKGFPSKKD